jgi:hypothetical protein
VTKLVLTAGCVAVGLALTVAGAAVARGQATEIQLAATLTAAQEVPNPTGSVAGARGTFTASVTKSDGGGVLEWRLAFSGLTGRAIAAHIHLAPPGQSAGVAVPLCAPCESDASGRANINATVLNALENGGAYVNIHTPTNTAGEVRGQVAVVDSIRTTLTAKQEVPRPRGARRARGTFTADVRTSGSGAVLTWRLTFTRLTGKGIAAHIHLGRRGKPGAIAVTLCGPCKSGKRGRATVRGSVLTALEAGRAYVNVHTRRNPAGEIRGQLPPVALRVTALSR